MTLGFCIMFLICFYFYLVCLLCVASSCSIGASCKFCLYANSVFYPSHFLFLARFFLPLFFVFLIFEHPCHTMILLASLFSSEWSQVHVGLE